MLASLRSVLMCAWVLLLWPVTTATVPFWKNPSYSPIPNLSSALRGYNIFIAEPFSATQIDPGFRQMLFESVTTDATGSVSLQSGIDAADDLSCKSGTRESIITSMDEYRNDQLESTVLGSQWSIGPEIDVNVGIDKGPVKVGGSSKIEPFIQASDSNSRRLSNLEKFFATEKGVMVKLEATCFRSTIMLNRYNLPEFRPGFKASVRKLHEAFTRGQMESEIRKFFHDYGTHYSSETRLGARLIYNRRFTKREREVLKTTGLYDCTKQQTKLSAFVASSQKQQNSCTEIEKESKTFNSQGLTREEVISFGSRPHSQTGEWSRQDLDDQVPIKQKLEPIWRLFENMARFDIATTDSSFVNQFRQFYDDICSIMGYSCEDVCGRPGHNHACEYNQNCIRLWYPKPGQMKFICENVKPVVYWRRNAEATGYAVKLFELGTFEALPEYAPQCNLEFCNMSFPHVRDTTKTFVYKVDRLLAGIHISMPNDQGTDSWLAYPHSSFTKPIKFLRIDGVTGYHVNVLNLNTMATLYEYVPQCNYVTHFTPEMVCRDLPAYYLTKRAREDLWSVFDAMYLNCKALDSGSRIKNTVNQGILKALETRGFQPIEQPKCPFSFPAESGQFDIIVTADIPGGGLIMQKFRVRLA